MELPKRKPNRLADYDYSTPNAYYITVCTDKRKNLFWENPDRTIKDTGDIVLSEIGEIVLKEILNISYSYENIMVDYFTIMPNHIHLLINIKAAEYGRPGSAPTISKVIGRTKSLVSKKAGFSVWQKGFYDHVVRDLEDYVSVAEYIKGNPLRWIEDKLYTK